MDTFKNKVVFITGASSGIGAATALLFAEHGAKIAISYKDNEDGAKELISRVRDGKYYQADLKNDNDAENLVKNVIKDFSRIDILINNAGGYIMGDEWDGSVDVWLESIKQNYISMLSTSKYVLNEFIKQQSGIIISVASRHGVSGIPDGITYSGSKAAVINATQAYAKLLSPFGRANAVSPAAVNAGYWLTAPKDELADTLENSPGHRLVEAEEVAQLIMFLASDASKNITGKNIEINGDFDLNKFKASM